MINCLLTEKIPAHISPSPGGVGRIDPTIFDSQLLLPAGFFSVSFLASVASPFFLSDAAAASAAAYGVDAAGAVVGATGGDPPLVGAILGRLGGGWCALRGRKEIQNLIPRI